jgi:hypothetical protein
MTDKPTADEARLGEIRERAGKATPAAEKALGSAQWQPITNADKQVGPSFFGGVWLETANGWEWHEHVAFWSAGMQSFCDTWSGERIDLEWRKPLPTPAPMPARALSAAGGQQKPVAAPILTERGRPCVPCGGTGIARLSRRSCLACNGTGTDGAGGQ